MKKAAQGSSAVRGGRRALTGLHRSRPASSGDLLDGIDLRDSAEAAQLGLQLAEDLQDRVRRERETAQALRDYLAALGSSVGADTASRRSS